MPVLQLIGGAMAGAVVGFLAGRSRVCSAGQCNVRVNTLLSTMAGAVLGAALSAYLAR